MNCWRRRTLPALIALALFASGIAFSADGPVVELRSGVIDPGSRMEATTDETAPVKRQIVRMRRAPGVADKAALESAGARVETPLPGWAYLVSVPAGRASTLSSVPDVDWIVPYLAEDKIAPEIAAVRGTADDTDDIVVLLHLFPDADVKAIAAELRASGLQVTAARGDSRFGRVVLLMTPEEVMAHRDDLAARNDVFWVDRRYRRTLNNDKSIWVSQSGLYAGQATPVFDHGVFGEGQIAAVLDTGLDADMCYFRDETLGLPPTNAAGGIVVDPDQRKVIAVDFLDPAENPSDPTQWDTHGHGTHVTGTLAGDDLANPIVHDPGDGMAPAAKLVIQDAGYAADDCGDLPGIGCPVTDLNPVFQQAYDQGARAHSNSWNDNENAAVQNNYTDASQDVDEFMWNHPDFLIVFACGNYPLGGTGTIGSPSTAKNSLATGGTYYGEYAEYLSDISAWGPTDDGRIKPDVVFPGASIISAGNDGDVTTNNCGTSTMTGTSMTAPGVTGSSLLIRDYFERGFYPTGAPVPEDGFTPSAALLKAMIINSAVPISFDAEGRPITIPSDEQGWGRVLLDNSLHFAGQNRGLWVDDHTAGFTGPGDPYVLYMMEVLDASEPLKVTLAWTDYPSTPAAATHLVNDLDLRVDGPGGSWYGNYFLNGHSVDHGEPDRLNNVEQVLVEVPQPGIYSIRISPWAIPSGPQPWALVVSGAFTMSAGPRPAYWSHVIDDSPPGGNGDGVLDPGETARIPVTMTNAGDTDATSVIATMYSNYPNLLKVYDSTYSYGDIAVDELKSSPAPHYEVTLEPAATCGQTLGASLGVTGDGFDVTTGFSIPIGLPFRDTLSPDTPLEIPRNDTGGVWSFINVPDDFPYNEVDVTVNIDHQDISELQVLLYAPGNIAINLHHNTDPGVSGIHTTYDDETEPAGPGTMADFLDLGPSGPWRLRAIDATSGGTPAGEIQNWTLHFKSDIPFDCHPVSCGEPVPPEVGATLMVSKSGASDVTIDWDAVGGASEYNVWRAADKQLLTNGLVGTTSATALTDGGAQTLPGAHFYVVRSVNSCRWESP